MNAFNTDALSLAEARLTAQGVHMDTKTVLSGASHRSRPRCVHYQDILAAAGRCTEAHACKLYFCSWLIFLW